MSTIVVDVSVTYTGSFTKSAIPTLPPQTGTRTMSASDPAITDLAERTRKFISNMLQGLDSNADRNTTVVVTVT